MNYPTFLNKVDGVTTRCDVDALRRFTHELARTVPESDRERFLTLLVGYCDIGKVMPSESEQPSHDLKAKVDEALRVLRLLEDGDRALEAECNETWDDWCDDEEDEFEFSDPDGILDDVSEAFDLLHACLDQAEYVKGAELADALSALRIQVSGDYMDYDDDALDIQGLVYRDLLQIDLKHCLKEAVYLACMGNEAQRRAEAMLTILDGFDDYSVSLDEILTTGPEEINLSELLPSWIEALAKRPEKHTDDLLVEAQEMLSDRQAVLNNASLYAKTHPVLYRDVLESGFRGASPDELAQIGLRGIKEVPNHHPMRATIALLTAKYALSLQDRPLVEHCWLEAFTTSPTVVNYLRLRLLTQSRDHCAASVRAAYESYYNSMSAWERKPLAVLMFFDGRFDEMLARFMSQKEGIGWSSTFMKEGIALLLMLTDMGNTERPGMKEMRNKAIKACSFEASAYCQGTDIVCPDSNEELFSDCFRAWRERLHLPQDQCGKWLNKIKNWVSLRVDAIMDANRRNYYGECAAFIAALGEVLESRGTPGVKQALMLQYKLNYSRRRAFHEALREYGMRA